MLAPQSTHSIDLSTKLPALVDPPLVGLLQRAAHGPALELAYISLGPAKDWTALGEQPFSVESAGDVLSTRDNANVKRPLRQRHASMAADACARHGTGLKATLWCHLLLLPSPCIKHRGECFDSGAAEPRFPARVSHRCAAAARGGRQRHKRQRWQQRRRRRRRGREIGWQQPA